jgi:hypothetical protein
MARVDPATDPLNDQMYEKLRLNDFLRHFTGQVAKVETEASEMSTAGPFLDEDTEGPAPVKKSRQQRRAELKKDRKKKQREAKKST